MQSTLNSKSAASKVLVVSHNSALLCTLWSREAAHEWALDVVASPWEAMEKIQAGAKPDLVLLDLSQENGEGLHILRWMRRLCSAMPIVILGRMSDEPNRTELMLTGATELVEDPFQDGLLEQVIERNVSAQGQELPLEMSSDDVEPIGGGRSFVGVSPAMRRLREQASLLAQTDAPVLIVGEHGSGKETLGRLIHRLSVRSGFDYGLVTCTALPADLLSRELFGYEGTAGKLRQRAGKIELCAKGTLLLREITEIPLQLQDQLVDVLRYQRFMAPGSGVWRETDVRILATTCTDIGRAVQQNLVRRELYLQLSKYTVQVPRLRDRAEEIPLLAMHFMHRLTKHYGLPPRDFSEELLAAWQEYQWPGNLRELEHRVKRYLMLGDEEQSLEEIRSDTALRAPAVRGNGFESGSAAAAGMPRGGSGNEKSLRSLVQSVKSEAEKRAILVALERTGWNRKAAARLLNVSYRTVLYKIQQYQMGRPGMPRMDRSVNVASDPYEENRPPRPPGQPS